jgi:hypothetical protein
MTPIKRIASLGALLVTFALLGCGGSSSSSTQSGSGASNPAGTAPDAPAAAAPKAAKAPSRKHSNERPRKRSAPAPAGGAHDHLRIVAGGQVNQSEVRRIVRGILHQGANSSPGGKQSGGTHQEKILRELFPAPEATSEPAHKGEEGPTVIQKVLEQLGEGH